MSVIVFFGEMIWLHMWWLPIIFTMAQSRTLCGVYKVVGFGFLLGVPVKPLPRGLIGAPSRYGILKGGGPRGGQVT